jgi:hypothetical protein
LNLQSKIVAALLGHAKAGVLGKAVDALPSIAAQSIHHSNSRTESRIINDVNIPHNPNMRRTRDDLRIEKLVPSRQGGWSWDGQSNKMAKRITPHTGVKKMSGDTETTRDEVELSSCQIASGGSWTTRDVIKFHAVLWLPYNSSDITIEIDVRERFHTLIQTAVCTLWRSRVASEAQSSSTSGTSTTEKSVADNSVTHESVTGKIVSDKSVALFDVIRGTDKAHPRDEINEAEIDCNMIKTKKRKTDNIPGVGRQIQPSCPIQPTLSLVFLDSSTASITQEQLTLNMARRRMAAPTEYQVLLSLIELLSDPILNLIKNQKAPKEQNSSTSFPPRLKSSSDLEKSGDPVDSGGEDKEEFSQSSEPWIRSLNSLLPTGLNRKERKKILIIDVKDLVSTDFGPNVADGTYGSHCKIDSTKSNRTTHTPPCLSSIAYSARCGCSVQDDASQDETPERENIVLVLLRTAAYYMPVTEKKGVLKGLNKGIGPMTSLSRSRTVPACGSGQYLRMNPGHSNRTQTERETLCLDYMLNTWLYGPKSGKHDLTVPSKLYCMARISYTPRSHPSDAMQDMSGRDRGAQEMIAEYIAPATAVCVLQHWAYHRRLLPTLKIAAEAYLA